MPLLLEQLKTRLARLGETFSPGQLLSMAGAFLVVVGVLVGSAWYLNTPSYRVLFSDLDAESAAEVVDRLRAQDVPYELADGGRTVRVPDDQIDQLRLDFSSRGLPETGRIGFEIFDRTQFGATEFLEQVNYRRALEGEIARTISTIAEIASARVHIAMAKDSLFGDRVQPAKASVILKLRHQGRTLAPATVQGIASLVAASVEGLRPEAVVVMDNYGRPLVRPVDEADAPLGSAEVERQQRFERELATRVVALLEPVVGEDRVRVNVAARLSAASEDRVEESWDPNAVVRSRAVTQEGGPGAGGSAGIAGARANLPGPVAPGATTPATPTQAPAPAQVAAAAVPGRSSETTNYEIGKVVRRTVRPRGDVERISVAVILDDEHVVQKKDDGSTARTTKPRDPAEMQKIHGLVAAAVGLDAARGDQLTVENVAFEEVVSDDVAPPTMLERSAPVLKEVGRVVAVIVLGVLAFLLVGRPMLRPRAVAAQVSVRHIGPEQLPRTIEELEGEIEAQLDAEVAARMPSRRVPVLSKRLGQMAQKEPDSAARLMRAWLLEDRAKS